jgi:hypothetical protein
MHAFVCVFVSVYCYQYHYVLFQRVGRIAFQTDVTISSCLTVLPGNMCVNTTRYDDDDDDDDDDDNDDAYEVEKEKNENVSTTIFFYCFSSFLK